METHRVLGDASYSLYLLHFPVMVVMLQLLSGASLSMVRIPGLLAAVLVGGSVAVAMAFHAMIERPVTDWLRIRADGLGAAERGREPATA